MVDVGGVAVTPSPLSVSKTRWMARRSRHRSDDPRSTPNVQHRCSRPAPTTPATTDWTLASRTWPEPPLLPAHATSGRDRPSIGRTALDDPSSDRLDLAGCALPTSCRAPCATRRPARLHSWRSSGVLYSGDHALHRPIAAGVRMMELPVHDASPSRRDSENADPRPQRVRGHGSGLNHLALRVAGFVSERGSGSRCRVIAHNLAQLDGAAGARRASRDRPTMQDAQVQKRSLRSRRTAHPYRPGAWTLHLPKRWPWAGQNLAVQAPPVIDLVVDRLDRVLRHFDALPSRRRPGSFEARASHPFEP